MGERFYTATHIYSERPMDDIACCGGSFRLNNWEPRSRDLFAGLIEVWTLEKMTN